MSVFSGPTGDSNIPISQHVSFCRLSGLTGDSNTPSIPSPFIDPNIVGEFPWTRVNDVDAPPQANSTGKRNSFYVIEFHRAGATQVNLVKGTRRPVRRVLVDVLHGDATIIRGDTELG